MALGAYQKISRVLPGRPFGDGSDGAKTISSDTTQNLEVASITGSSGNKTLTLANLNWTDGDVVLLHQSRGTGVGQWEINRVASGGGTTTITLQENMQYTYTDSGSSQAQGTKIPMYSSVTVDSGKTWTPNLWDGNRGGTLLFACNGTTTVTGTITTNGKGHNGGTASSTGEGTIGASVGNQHEANGSGGGGGTDGDANYPAPGGGGGGHKSSGSTGGLPSSQSGGPNPGIGGGTGGAATLTTLIFGGAGGGGKDGDVDFGPPRGGGPGGGGGGGIFIFAKTIATITGYIYAKGSQGSAGGHSSAGAGGAGAGGSVIMQVEDATLGTSRIVATGGAQKASGGEGGYGGAGGTGRIAIHRSGTVTGTTNPTLSNTEDSTLIESTGAFLNLI